MRLGMLKKEEPEKVFVYVGNSSGTATLPAGEPTCFVMDGTRDGFNITDANTGGAAKATTLFAGVPVAAIPPNEKEWAQVFGLVEALVLVRQSRAASTNSYASAPAVVIGDKLQVDASASANGFVREGAGAQDPLLGFAIAAGALASKASSASSGGDSSTRTTDTIKAFVRAM